MALACRNASASPPTSTSSPWRRAISRPASSKSARPSSCSSAACRTIAISFSRPGLAQAVEYLLNLRFTAEEIDYLRTLPQFAHTSAGFFDMLAGLRFHRRPVRRPRRHAAVSGRAVPHAARAAGRSADPGNVSSRDHRIPIHDRDQSRARGESGAGTQRGRVRHAARAFARSGRARGRARLTSADAPAPAIRKPACASACPCSEPPRIPG